LASVIEVFDELEGEWIISRCIIPGGQMSGHGVFEKNNDNELKYQEIGVLTLDNGQVLKSQKQYNYVLTDEGKIEIYFADGVTSGMHFQTLICDRNGVAQAKHYCDPDIYKSHYDFSKLSAEIKIIHDALGPKKKYRSTTILTRKT
jgi:hypothetical protein